MFKSKLSKYIYQIEMMKKLTYLELENKREQAQLGLKGSNNGVSATSGVDFSTGGNSIRST